jgi:hypothetical protein
VLVNNSNKKLKWGLDLRKVGKAMEEGILKFLHNSGVPFVNDGSSNGIEGELEPGQTMPITVAFCPSEFKVKVKVKTTSFISKEQLYC